MLFFAFECRDQLMLLFMYVLRLSTNGVHAIYLLIGVRYIKEKI